MAKKNEIHELPKGAVRGRLHVLAGRGRTGKSTHGRWVVGRAADQGRPLAVVDADRNNATLASFSPGAVRPDDADDETMSALLEDQTEKLVQSGGSMLIDLGGGDRIFAKVAEAHHFMEELPLDGIETIAWHFLAGGRDDIETIAWMEEAGLRASKTAIVLNEGLAPRLPGRADPFTEALASRTIRKVLDRGGRIVRMPPLRLDTMNRADGLFISFSAAAAGGVPEGDDGRPHPEAMPLGHWRQKELTRWLRVMEERHAEAGVAEWLP